MAEYKIEEYNHSRCPDLQPLLTQSHFSPYRNISFGNDVNIQPYWLARIKKSSQGEKSKAFFIEAHNRVIGFLQSNDLDWDSQLFGWRMCSIQELIVDESLTEKDAVIKKLVSYFLDWAKMEKYQFVLAKTYTNDMLTIHNLECNGFLLVDTLLDFAVDFLRTPFSSLPVQDPAQGVDVRMVEPGDEQELMSLAKTSFQNHFGRYHSDPHFTNEQATQVYSQWMQSSIRGYADYFVVAEVDGHIAGLSIWKKPSDMEKNHLINIGHYSLGAVHPNFSGRRIFNLVTYEGMKLFDGVSGVIEGPTHINNYPVQRGYGRLGWQIFDARHSFHKWLI